jgi:hypothetical protein
MLFALGRDRDDLQEMETVVVPVHQIGDHERQVLRVVFVPNDDAAMTEDGRERVEDAWSVPHERGHAFPERIRELP